MRMTKQRKAVIDLFEDNNQPMSAEMLSCLLPQGTMNLSTVYRILERLYDSGVISKSIIEHTAYYYLNDENHHHFIICTKCKKMLKLDCRLAYMDASIEKETKFKILQHELTYYGLCPNCQKT